MYQMLLLPGTLSEKRCSCQKKSDIQFIEMEPVIVTIKPGAKTDVDMPHEGQEFGFVVDGEIILVIDKKEHVCKKGESFYFTTDKNHYIKNNKNKDAKVIWISSPPNF